VDEDLVGLMTQTFEKTFVRLGIQAAEVGIWSSAFRDKILFPPSNVKLKSGPIGRPEISVRLVTPL